MATIFVLALLLLSTGHAAFCVWLLVRYINGRERNLIDTAVKAMRPAIAWAIYIALFIVFMG
ncbi:MAG TPA: hypothetical protein VGM05_20065 [Planctomycetaceae bacterium]|jgi:heme A synthase